MELLIENIIIYGTVGLLCLIIILLYLRKQKRVSAQTKEKIRIAKEEGLFEPVSLHPVVDVKSCIKTGACIAACPEKDILGIVDGKATTVNASRCIGHGACFHACPTQAISLYIGTEKRGVDLPHVSQSFETNVPGMYIAGELGGMGLIKNAVEQGKQAVQNLQHYCKEKHKGMYDLIIVGAGPAGVSASLMAKSLGLNSLTLEQDSLGGTVYTFPRSKIVMTSSMELPLYGKLKLFETSKQELLDIWTEVLSKNNISIKENTKVNSITKEEDLFHVITSNGEFTSRTVLVAIGRRGTPRKLGIPGEMGPNVAYRLLEPEDLEGKNIMVVGGGDSAVESALLLNEKNNVILSYRKASFSRLKPKNKSRIEEAIQNGSVKMMYNSSLTEIQEDKVFIRNELGEIEEIKNDLVYIFIGGELPTKFLENAGIKITKKFGEAVLTH